MAFPSSLSLGRDEVLARYWASLTYCHPCAISKCDSLCGASEREPGPWLFLQYPALKWNSSRHAFLYTGQGGKPLLCALLKIFSFTLKNVQAQGFMRI